MGKPPFKKYFLLIPLLLLYINLYSQSYLVYKYQKEDGLPDLNVYDICQDAEGNMWFATKEGVTIYDGSDWTYFDSRYILKNLEYRFISTDARGDVWTVSDNPNLSIEEYTDRWTVIYKSDTSKISPGAIKSLDIWHLGEDDLPVITTVNGDLYILKDENLSKIDKFNGSEINAVKIIKGSCFAAANNRIYKSADGENFSLWHEDKLRSLDFSIKDFSIENDDDLSPRAWILGSGKIAKITSDKNEVYQIKMVSTDSFEPKIFIDDYFDNLVIGNNAAIYLWDKKYRSLNRIGIENGLSKEGANSIFLDLEKNLWIAGQKGVSKLSSMRFTNYKKDYGLLNNNISSIMQYGRNTLLIGHPDGISFMEGNSVTTIPFNTRRTQLHKSIGRTTVVRSPKYTIIASTQMGFGEIINSRQVSWYPRWYYRNEKPVTIIKDSEGKIFAATEKSVFRITMDGFDEITFPGKFPNLKINNISIGLKDELIVATNGDGILVREKNGEWKQYYSEINHAYNKVYCTVYIENLLLAGTSGGLSTVENNKIEHYDISELDIMESVFSLLLDKDASLWIGTSGGVYKWDRNYVEYYGSRQGLAGTEVGIDAIFEDTRGKIWIGTVDGLSAYNKEFDYDSKMGPILTIEEVEAGGRILSVLENTSVPFDNNNLLFKINVNSFIDEKLNKYSVLLEGFDNEWIEDINGSQKYIRYTNLSPGNYRLMVRAKDAMSNWSSPLATGVITVKKPFYKETWFFVPVIVLIGIIIFSFVIYFERARYAERLEGEVVLRTKEIEESQKRYHRMFESNKAVLLIVDADKCEIVDANPAAREFYGKILTQGERIPLNKLDVEVKEKSEYENLLDSLSTSSYHTTQHKVKGGKIREVELYFSKFSTEEGNLFFVIVHDITETLENKEQLKKLTAAVEQSSQMIFITNTNGTIEYVNPKFCEITGYSREESIGQNPRILKSGKREEEDYKRLWDTISAGGQYSGEFLNKKKNGELIWVSALVGPVRTADDRISHYLAVEEDITEKKISQQELIKSEAKVKAILNAIPDLMLQINSKGKLVGCHFSKNNMLVAEPSEILNKNIETVLPKDLAKQMMTKVKETLKNNEFEKFDYRFSNNGSEIFYECRLIKNDEETVLTILRDITQRKLFEKDIILAKEEAEKSDKLKTEFLAHMSHEIRTPVNSIVNFSDVIREDLKDKLDPQVVEKLSHIESNSRRLINTVDSIIEIAKIQSGSYEADIEVFDLISCMNGVVKDLEEEAVEKNIVLSYTSKIEKVYIKADNLSVREIFYQLIDNAIKFTKAGTVKVDIDMHGKTKVKVTVSDTGVGISEKFKPDLFKAFSQEHTGLSRGFEGNGLGLALVKSYSDLNSGKIEFDSKKGKGSTFSVIFKTVKPKGRNS